MLYIEGALFQHLATGIERVAACYHVSSQSLDSHPEPPRGRAQFSTCMHDCCGLAQEVEFARIWGCRASPFKADLIRAAAEDWACPEAAISGQQLQ